MKPKLKNGCSNRLSAHALILLVDRLEREGQPGARGEFAEQLRMVEPPRKMVPPSVAELDLQLVKAGNYSRDELAAMDQEEKQLRLQVHRRDPVRIQKFDAEKWRSQ